MTAPGDVPGDDVLRVGDRWRFGEIAYDSGMWFSVDVTSPQGEGPNTAIFGAINGSYVLMRLPDPITDITMIDQQTPRRALGEVRRWFSGNRQFGSSCLNHPVPERIRNGAEVLSADDATRNRQINAALDTEMNIEVESEPLRDVVRRLEKTHGIEFEIDMAGLRNIGLQAGAPVTANLSNTSLRSGLELLLRDLGLMNEKQLVNAATNVCLITGDLGCNEPGLGDFRAFFTGPDS